MSIIVKTHTVCIYVAIELDCKGEIVNVYSEELSMNFYNFTTVISL